jgi:hypothetical protein
MDAFTLPAEVTLWISHLAVPLDARLRWRLAPLICGILFAHGRRTVARWLRAGGLSLDFRNYYYFLGSVGRNARLLARGLLRLVLDQVAPEGRLRLALDDSPTARFGRHVQGAGVHHNPTPGPAGEQFLYGHVWVTLAVIATHPHWGAIALPILALVYVRAVDVARLPRGLQWKFQTKLELAAELLEWAVWLAQARGLAVWVAVDGGYAKRPFLKRALAAGVVVVSRLRKDAALRSVPAPGPRKGPGRPRKYGVQRISLASRAGHPGGWRTQEFTLYRKRVQKTYKTFLATYPPAGGLIRVVLVKEEHGWVAFFCTHPAASVQEILEMVADRSSLEQCFHDVKEVHGAGQQQVRYIWANVAAYHLSLWVHTLIELWAWDKPHEELCDRSASPWDDPDRRPSHADRRNALRRQCLTLEFSRVFTRRPQAREIRRTCERLMDLALSP